MKKFLFLLFTIGLGTCFISCKDDTEIGIWTPMKWKTEVRTIIKPKSVVRPVGLVGRVRQVRLVRLV